MYINKLKKKEIMISLYKRNAQCKPLVWSGEEKNGKLEVTYGLVGGTMHTESIIITKKNVNELQSRVNAKRKEGYKELHELKDNNGSYKIFNGTKDDILPYLNAYLPKYSTTSEGFVLPMLAKVLEDNKPFEKCGTMLGQWKIDGLRCIIGAEETHGDLFNPYHLTYHSRTGEDWTAKMCWMDELLLPKISKELLDMMIEEGACLDGELYLPGYSVNDINSFVKNTQLAQHYKLQYWCYDICCENMSALQRNIFRINNIDLEEKQMTYNDHLNNKSQFVILPTLSVDSISKATIIRNNFIAFGFEGLILRNPSAEYQFGKRNQAMFKFKKIDDGKFIIVDIKSEHKRSDLPLFVCRNDINDELFECSINKPQNEQRNILINKDKYVGKYAFIEYRQRSGINQVPFHARIINICLD
ncbi:MAG: ATP-dependent DNA ligase [Bacilli bacterium]|nr:ATP-dependent DNA ligase [Bacilli bacterium]